MWPCLLFFQVSKLMDATLGVGDAFVEAMLPKVDAFLLVVLPIHKASYHICNPI